LARKLGRRAPVSERLLAIRTLNDLVRSGKVRYFACSNFAAWQLCEASWTSRAHNLEAFIAIQSEYNLLERGIEREVVPCCQAHGVGVVHRAPLARGFLTGKYRRGKEERFPKGARLGNKNLARQIMSDANIDKLAMLEAFAEERGHSVGDLAVAWLLAHPWLGSVIAGADNVDQVSENVARADWRLTSEDVALLDKLV
jgi:aryl-alcohol dehydrogenase-like predicted oxidoreductase